MLARRPLILFAATFAAAAITACGQQRTERQAVPPTEMADFAAPAPDVSRGVAVESKAMAPADRGQAPLPRPAGDSIVPSMIIRNGFVSIEVDSLEIAVAGVRALAARMGGYIGNVTTTTGEYAVRSATLEVKIPAARFDEALSGLSPLGKVEQSNTTAEDVGEEFVDLTARMANSRRLEERLVQLLATRAGKLEDVLAVERELARVREEIERVEGRMRYLKTRAAVSTLSVTVHERAPLVSPGTPGENVIAEAFKDMWRNFVQLVALAISSLGVVVPVGAVLALVAWWWRRRRRGRAA